MRVFLWAILGMQVAVADPATFWSAPRRGTNYFAGMMTPEWATAAHAAGIEWVRLTSANWPKSGRDHLLGTADDYTRIPAADLAQLRAQLDLAQAHGLGVVFTMLSLPGARWRQHNDNRNDLRLWRDPRFRVQSAAFWRDLAAAIGDHPALVAVNPLNEPRPLRAAQVDSFNADVVAGIRAVRPRLPILLDVGLDAAPATIVDLAPLADANVLYGVHVYEPWEFVTWRIHEGKLSYPGPDAEGTTIDAGLLAATLQPVITWQKRNGIASDRIVLAEFGIDRRMRGAGDYLRDVICIAEAQRWHWAFYAFRDWQALDYELGDGPLPKGWWEAEERGEPLPRPARAAPLFEVLRRGLAGTLCE